MCQASAKKLKNCHCETCGVSNSASRGISTPPLRFLDKEAPLTASAQASEQMRRAENRGNRRSRSFNQRFPDALR